MEHLRGKGYGATRADAPPSRHWYFGWVLYANRAKFLRHIDLLGLALSLDGLAAILFGWRLLVPAAVFILILGLAQLAHTVSGLYVVWGPLGSRTLRELFAVGGRSPMLVADLNLGSYRSTHELKECFPGATIDSVDIWDFAGRPDDANLQLLRSLDTRPVEVPGVNIMTSNAEHIPIADGTCDAVVMSLGIHELPGGDTRERLILEAKRLLRDGAPLLIVEHSIGRRRRGLFGSGDPHTPRQERWDDELHRRFLQVHHRRRFNAIDVYVAYTPADFFPAWSVG